MPYSNQLTEMKTYPRIMRKDYSRILARFQKVTFFPTIVVGILIQVLPDPAPSSVKSCAKFCFTLSLFQSKERLPLYKSFLNQKLPYQLHSVPILPQPPIGRERQTNVLKHKTSAVNKRPVTPLHEVTSHPLSCYLVNYQNL